MIQLKNVNKYFNRRKANEIHVINNTSLELPESGIVALLGPSGCGKTTLLNAIGGLDKINSGKMLTPIPLSTIAMIAKSSHVVKRISGRT